MPAGRPQKSDFGSLYGHACHFYWEFKGIQGEDSKEKGPWRIPMNGSGSPVFVPGEPEIIDKLLSTDSPDRIRRMCARAFLPPQRLKGEDGQVYEIPRPAWPISGQSLLPTCLSKYAEQFIEARKDPRFPKSGRPTSRLKQLWFLSRALAGAVHGMATRTAINQIGSVRPDEPAKLSRNTRQTRTPKSQMEREK